MITVFTPTYNRAYIINKLYTSLCLQTCQDFEWLIVDDGSTDTTESLITSFIEEHKMYLQLIIPQYFISNKSGIWSLSLIVHSKG